MLHHLQEKSLAVMLEMDSMENQALLVHTGVASTARTSPESLSPGTTSTPAQENSGETYGDNLQPREELGVHDESAR